MSILRNIGLFGIGVIVLTQEKLEEFTQEMIKKGEINQEEGRQFVVDVLLEKERQLEEIEAKVCNIVRDAIENSGVATKKDIRTIENRLDTLEKDIIEKLMA